MPKTPKPQEFGIASMVACIAAGTLLGILSGLCVFIILLFAGTHLEKRGANPAVIVSSLCGLAAFFFGGAWCTEKLVPLAGIQANIGVYLMIVAAWIIVSAVWPLWLLVKHAPDRIFGKGKG